METRIGFDPGLRTVILLGAGASIDGGFPDAYSLVDRIEDLLEAQYGDGPLLAVFRHIRMSMQEHLNDKVDAEHLHTAIATIANWSQEPAAPAVEPIELHSWTREYPQEAIQTLARRIPILVQQILNPPLSPEQFSYLAPLFKLKCGDETRIATLNYDLGVETAAAAKGLSVDSGPWGLPHGFSWVWEGHDPNAIKLLKLHGSVDWSYFYDQPPYIERILYRRVVFNPENPGRWVGNGLIFGRGGKLRTSGPYLAMLAEFESWLETAEQLLLIGYSFRDDHINDIISWSALQGMDYRFTVVDPSWPIDSTDLDIGNFRRVMNQMAWERGSLDVRNVTARKFLETLA